MIETLLDYNLDDLLLFSPEVYYRLLSQYNASWWPLQVVGLLAGLWILWSCTRAPNRDARLSLIALALAWVFIGIAFHINRYSAINWMAVWFGAAFIAQGLLLGLAGLQGTRFVGLTENHFQILVAAMVLLVGVAGYPLAALLQGQPIDALPVFGVAIVPTLLVTLCVLSFLQGRRWWLFVLPLLLILIEGLTLYLIGSREWIVILLSLMILLMLLVSQTLLRSKGT